jgi:hypothetical protein
LQKTIMCTYVDISISISIYLSIPISIYLSIYHLAIYGKKAIKMLAIWNYQFSRF